MSNGFIGFVANEKILQDAVDEAVKTVTGIIESAISRWEKRTEERIYESLGRLGCKKPELLFSPSLDVEGKPRGDPKENRYHFSVEVLIQGKFQRISGGTLLDRGSPTKHFKNHY